MPERRDGHTPGRHVALPSAADRKWVIWGAGLILTGAGVFAFVLIALALR
jgi:hypothetical protein